MPSLRSVNKLCKVLTFIPNVHVDTRRCITQILGVNEVVNHGKYLGLSSMIGSSKKNVLDFIFEKAIVKIIGCSKKKCHIAGKKFF